MMRSPVQSLVSVLPGCYLKRLTADTNEEDAPILPPEIQNIHIEIKIQNIHIEIKIQINHVEIKNRNIDVEINI